MPTQFGNTWWGQAYLGALTRIDYENRLARGKSYARNNRIADLHIDDNVVHAKVRGSRPKPYTIKIIHTPLSRADQLKLTETLVSRPDMISEILNLRLPHEINDLCRQYDIKLFPESWRDIKLTCSCPDWAVPCKHLAAVIYTLANEIDKDPFLVFRLHKFDLPKELHKKGIVQAVTSTEPTITPLSSLISSKELQRGFPLFDRALYDQVDLSAIPNLGTSLPQYLDAAPVFYTQADFRVLFEQCYKRTIDYTQKLISSGETYKGDVNEQGLHKYDYLEMVVYQDLSFDTLWLDTADESGTRALKDMKDVIDLLMSLRREDLVQLAPDFSLLFLAWEIAHHAVSHGAFVPVLYKPDQVTYKIHWEPFLTIPAMAKIIDELTCMLRQDFLTYRDEKDNLRFFEPDKQACILISLFIQQLVLNTHAYIKKYDPSSVTELFFEGWIRDFSSISERKTGESIHQWLDVLHPSRSGFQPCVCIHESRSGAFELSVSLASTVDEFMEWVPLSEFMGAEKYKPYHISVMKMLGRLSDRIPPLRKVVQHFGGKKIRLKEDEVIGILQAIEKISLLTYTKIILPKSLEKTLRPRRSLQIRKESGLKSSGLLSLNKLLTFDWRIALGDHFVSPEEFRMLTEKSGRLVKIKDHYIILDPEDVTTLLAKHAEVRTPTGAELLRFALAQEYEGSSIEISAEVKKWLESLRTSPRIPLPSGINATLRPYQVSGYEWLWKNARMGFGSILADDMGLGKTIQVLTFLQKAKQDGWLQDAPALIIAPATLLTNWMNECERFTPELTAQIYHGAKREMKDVSFDLLITTYGLARRDQTAFQQMEWSVMVIDEAQNIKSNVAAQTKSILNIPAGVRIAMSGTPVENRLSEYFSISQFVNPGYLGTLASFKREFASPIEQHRDLHQLDIFKRMTSPFILRRLKTDKKIIQDLPDKININRYVTLTPQQAGLYEVRTQEILAEIKSKSGIARRGLVLMMLLQLKQICNHPANFLKQGKKEAALTGKAEALKEVLDIVLAEGKKVLIFTQYREMGDILLSMIKEWGEEAAFLHGGLSRKERDEIVTAFQQHQWPRVLILSIKAAGTGLNLTAATHVIHYDLWWNPAVEAQATDRAFRIGQRFNVTVHRIITRNTLEEHIDQLIQKKKDLADLTVASGEKWIGEMTNAEIEQLVKRK